MMKFIFKVICVLVILTLTQRSIAQDTQSITASFQNVTLEEVLTHLSRQYNLKFSYSEDLVELNKNIRVHVDRASIGELLQLVFLQANVEYRYIGDQVVIREKPSSVYVVFRGKVIDKRSGEPLAFASVRIDGTGLGTATNHEGIFVLNVPSKLEKGELIISYIGYKNHVTALSALENETIFQLQEESRELQAVVVTAKTGPSILAEAISRIMQNYDTSDVRYTYFIRDVSLLDDAPIGASETLYEAYRGPQMNDPALQQVKFLSGRRVKDFGAVQRILQAFIRWTGFELGFMANVIFSADLNIHRNDDRFPSSKFMVQHEFDLLGISQYDGHEVYVIDFDQKPGVRKSLYKGRFYIDTESLAFSRIEIGLSPQGIGQARFFNTPKAMAMLFGYGKCAVTASKTIINYQSLKGKWYPATIEEYWSAALVQPKREFYSGIEVKANIVVTDIQTENISPLSSDEILAVGDYKNWEYLYRSKSLRQFNAIETDVDIQQAFQAISDKNRSQGIDMRFWKRFQPYKSDPSLLVRDSLLCMQSITSDMGIHSVSHGVANENNTMAPKYPLLNKSFSTRHFVFHYIQQDSASAREVSEVLEANYEKVLHEFSLKNFEGSTHVEIYPNVSHYHFAIGKFEAPDSDAGMAVDMNLFKMVSPGNPGTYHTRESLLRAAVHEFAHCVHYHFIEGLSMEERTAIVNKEETPWLFEAMASYCAGQFYDPSRFEYILRQQYPTLQMLNEVEEDSKIYDLGFVIIEFIKHKWGREGLIDLLRKNGNVRESLDISEFEFEDQLYEYINSAYCSGQK